MPYARVRGVNLYYEEHGSGPPLVVLHGLLGSVATATASGMGPGALAAQGLRVIAYDARGHGRSEPSERAEDYRWSALAEDLGGLLDALGIERANLYGTSMGAGSCLMFALSRPERVQRLVLRAPPPFEPDLGTARLRLGVLSLLYRCFGPSLTARLLVPVTGSAERARMRAMIRDQRGAPMVAAIQGLLFDPNRLPLERMSEIDSPTLILAHAGDAQHPLRSGQALVQLMRHAQLDVAPSSRHRREAPEATARTVAEFVKRG